MNEYENILSIINSIPYGPEREKALRLELAKAWHQGWETAYNDGGVDSNPYMTMREIRERNERITGEHDTYLRDAAIRIERKKAADDARVTASVTGSVGCKASRSFIHNNEEITVHANYSREGSECETCGAQMEHYHYWESVKPKA